MIRSIATLARHLDIRGRSRIADELDRVICASKYDWPKQYQLDIEAPRADERPWPTDFWSETNVLDTCDAPDAHPYEPLKDLPEGTKFSTLPATDEYSGEDWWTPLPDAYSRMYQLLYTLRDIEDRERKVSSGEYLEDPQNVELLRIQTARPRIEKELETLVRHMANLSYEVVQKWVIAHQTTSHPLMGDAVDDILQDEQTSPEEKSENLIGAISSSMKLMRKSGIIDAEGAARMLGVTLDDDRLRRFEEDPDEALEEMVKESTAADEDDEGWHDVERMESLGYVLSDILNTPQFAYARRQEMLATHPAFEQMEDILHMFEKAGSWRDLIIPIDIVRDIAHRNGELMEDYGGFHPDYDYRTTFDEISGGQLEPQWNRQMRTMGSPSARWIRMSRSFSTSGPHRTPPPRSPHRLPCSSR